MRTPEQEYPARSRTARAAAGTGRAAVGIGRAARAAGRGLRRAANAEGAGESGLGRLVELHTVVLAGDTLVTLALAGTLFFAVPVGEARGRVALYLLTTMAPFVIVAPVIGPLLDRLRHGRRWALAATCGVRAVLAWLMAVAVAGPHQDAALLYPSAFLLLVASRAYTVTRAAMVPRVLPAAVSLVRANSRVTMAGLAATAVAAPLAVGLAHLGVAWPLGLAVPVYAVGAWLCLTLPKQADSAAGEETVTITGTIPLSELRRGVAAYARAEERARSGTLVGRAAAEWGRRRAVRGVGPVVVTALRANAALRALAGFLTLFLAFLVRAHPIGGLSPTMAVAVAAVAATVGSVIGTGLGSLLRRRAPEALAPIVLTTAAVCSTLGAVVYGLITVLLVAAATGFAQSLGKLGLDALIQREVPERWRTSAFARSETTLQLAWVIGGAVGIVLPLDGRLGLGIAAGVMFVVLALTIRDQVRARGGAPQRAH